MTPTADRRRHFSMSRRACRGALKGAVLIAAGVLAACATSSAGDRQARLEAEIKARQGDPVDKICFMRSINGWRALDRKSLLLENGANHWYKLDLTGTCRPQWAFDTIGIRNWPAGAACLRKGDQIKTFDTPGQNETCFITDIYEWDEKAEVPEKPEGAKAEDDSDMY